MNTASKKIVTTGDLRNSIQSLEQHCRLTELQLKESFGRFKESLKPINLLKQLAHSVLPAPRQDQTPKLLNQQPGNSIRQLLMQKTGRKKVLVVDSK